MPLHRHPVGAVTSRPRLGLAAALAALVLAGCGSAPPTVRAPDGRVAVTLDDFLIAPQRVRVPPGRVTFTAVNRGRTAHTLRVTDGTRDLLKITTLLPGGRGEATATLAAGTYKLYCAIANHEELGMWGTLVVR
jgi:plastocyanin